MPKASDAGRPVIAVTSIVIMKIMFSNTGAAAAAANRPVAFKTPDTRAASEMNKIYGNARRPYSTARSKRSSPLNPDAIINTSAGMNITPSVVKITRTNASPIKASCAKSLASAAASVESCSFFENIGTKAMLNAPSAKKRRNILGRENATKNA